MTEVTCAVILQGERILVTQRSEDMPHPLKWEFPGGKLAEGESPRECIVREIREELGLEVEVNRALPKVTHDYGSGKIRLIPFLCSIRAGTLTLAEHRSHRWVEPGEFAGVDWLDADVEVVELLKKAWGIE